MILCTVNDAWIAYTSLNLNTHPLELHKFDKCGFLMSFINLNFEIMQEAF